MPLGAVATKDSSMRRYFAHHGDATQASRKCSAEGTRARNRPDAQACKVANTGQRYAPAHARGGGGADDACPRAGHRWWRSAAAGAAPTRTAVQHPPARHTQAMQLSRQVANSAHSRCAQSASVQARRMHLGARSGRGEEAISGRALRGRSEPRHGRLVARAAAAAAAAARSGRGRTALVVPLVALLPLLLLLLLARRGASRRGDSILLCADGGERAVGLRATGGCQQRRGRRCLGWARCVHLQRRG